MNYTNRRMERKIWKIIGHPVISGSHLVYCNSVALPT